MSSSVPARTLHPQIVHPLLQMFPPHRLGFRVRTRIRQLTPTSSRSPAIKMLETDSLRKPGRRWSLIVLEPLTQASVAFDCWNPGRRTFWTNPATLPPPSFCQLGSQLLEFPVFQEPKEHDGNCRRSQCPEGDPGLIPSCPNTQDPEGFQFRRDSGAAMTVKPPPVTAPATSAWRSGSAVPPPGVLRWVCAALSVMAVSAVVPKEQGISPRLWMRGFQPVTLERAQCDQAREEKSHQKSSRSFSGPDAPVAATKPRKRTKTLEEHVRMVRKKPRPFRETQGAIGWPGRKPAD